MLDIENWYRSICSETSLGLPISTSPLLIGEVGINHNGDLEIAKQIVEMAVKNGCDFVKFQKRNPDICVPDSKKHLLKETPWGVMTYLEYKKKIEFNKSDFYELDKFCKDLGVGWSASAWDDESQDFLKEFNLPFNKVASALNTKIDFIEKVASEKKLTFLSTGMATLSDIDNCVSVFKKYNCPLILFHTVSTYPAKDSELNLAIISTLKKRYRLPIGYSGHESAVTPSIIAAALGAVAIERHVTLDRTMWGTDQAASLEANGITQLSNALHRIPILMGNPDKKFFESEKKSSENLRYW